jgi:hypothetical protein
MALQTAAQVESMFRYTGGEAVVHGGTTTYGHYENADAPFESNGAAVYRNVKRIRVARGILGTIANGDAITVTGTSYTVNDHRVIDDGEFGDNAVIEIELKA